MMGDTGVLLTALSTAFIIWFLICGVVAATRVKHEERKVGFWSGPVFIFNEPILVLTKHVTPADHGKSFPFFMNDVEPDSLVEYEIRSPFMAGLIGTDIAGDHNVPLRDDCYSVENGKHRTGSNRRLSLHLNVKPNVSAQILHVYIKSFELGKGGYNGN